MTWRVRIKEPSPSFRSGLIQTKGDVWMAQGLCQRHRPCAIQTPPKVWIQPRPGDELNVPILTQIDKIKQ